MGPWEQYFGVGGDSGLARTDESTSGSTSGPTQPPAPVNLAEQVTSEQVTSEQVTSLKRQLAAFDKRLKTAEKSTAEARAEASKDHELVQHLPLYYAQLAERVVKLEKTTKELQQQNTALHDQLRNARDRLDKQEATTTTVVTACNNIVDERQAQQQELKDSLQNDKKFRICMQAVLRHLVSTEQFDPEALPKSHQDAINSLLKHSFTAWGGRTMKSAATSPAAVSSPGNSGNARMKSQAKVDKEADATHEDLMELGNDVRVIMYCMHTINTFEVGSKRKQTNNAPEFSKDVNAFIIALAVFPHLKKADIAFLETLRETLEKAAADKEQGCCGRDGDDLSTFHHMDHFFAETRAKAVAHKSITMLWQLTADPEKESGDREYAPMLCKVVFTRGKRSVIKNVWLTFEVKTDIKSERDAKWVLHGKLVRLCTDVLKNFSTDEKDELIKAKATMKFASPPDHPPDHSGEHSIDLQDLQGRRFATKLKGKDEMQRRIAASVFVPAPSVDIEEVWTIKPDGKATEMDWLKVFYPRDDVCANVESANRLCRDRNFSSVEHVIVGDAKMTLSSVVGQMKSLREMWEKAWTQTHPHKSLGSKQIIPWMLRASKYDDLQKWVEPVLAKLP